MKALILVAVLVCFTPLFGQSQNETIVKLDVKTLMNEKNALAVSKLGTIQFLNESAWARVVEVGEDYSLWLKNYEIMQADNEITISLDVELRTPAAFRNGRLLESRHIEVSFEATTEGEIVSLEMQFVGAAVIEAAEDMIF